MHTVGRKVSKWNAGWFNSELPFLHHFTREENVRQNWACQREVVVRKHKKRSIPWILGIFKAIISEICLSKCQKSDEGSVADTSAFSEWWVFSVCKWNALLFLWYCRIEGVLSKLAFNGPTNSLLEIGGKWFHNPRLNYFFPLNLLWPILELFG